MENPELFFALILGAIAVDFISGLTWWPAYFRYGIPLFVRRRPLPHALPVLPEPGALDDRFEGGWVVPIVFKRLSPSEIAVREAFWRGFFKFTYTPLVHGLLEVDPNARELRIVGHANAFPLVFLAAFAVPLSIRMNDPGAILIVVCLLVALFSIQFVRYGNVVHVTLRLMEMINDPI